MLWKPSGPDVIGWDSPWGRGRPGWHLECSAMIERHLGETIDIHGGGLDLVFPHHENEIAQSRTAHAGVPLARFWVHNGFVDMGAEKMSKSLGNVITPNELLAQGHRGETLRLALLSAHYRSPLPWTEALIEQARPSSIDGIDALRPNTRNGRCRRRAVCSRRSRDDLNTPLAIADSVEALKAATPRSRKLRRLKIELNERERPAARSLELLGQFTMSADWFQGDSCEAPPAYRSA